MNWPCESGKRPQRKEKTLHLGGVLLMSSLESFPHTLHPLPTPPFLYVKDFILLYFSLLFFKPIWSWVVSKRLILERCSTLGFSLVSTLYSFNNHSYFLALFRGADLAALVREASMAALRECINVRSNNRVMSDEDRPSIQSPVGLGMRHFSAAFQKVKPSVSKKVRTQ